jgi:DNA-binding CsgD family transcriptional regulator
MLAREDFRQVRGPAEAILAGGDRPGLDGALSGALTALAFIAWHDGRVVDAVSLFRAAVVRADSGPGEARRINPRLALAAALTALGDFGAAEALLVAGEREIRQSGDSMWADVPAIYRARLHLAAGRLDDAVADAHAGLIAAEGHGTRFFAPLALTTLATVAVLRGDLKEASRQVSAYRAAPPPPLAGFGSGAFNWVEARVADAQAGPGPAVDVLSDVYGDPVAHKRLLVEEPASAPWLVRVALAIGDRDRAEVIAGDVERLAAENAGVGSVTASANHARGLLARDPLALREAAAGHHHPWARGSAFEDAGLVELDAGDRSGARAALAEAVECYELAGATRDASRVRGRLRHIASRRSRAASRPVCGWGSLTDAERRVANVVAEGLTNPEVAARMYLSRYTVDFHLRQIFRKLGIRSRVELTRLVLTRAAGSA